MGPLFPDHWAMSERHISEVVWQISNQRNINKFRDEIQLDSNLLSLHWKTRATVVFQLHNYTIHHAGRTATNIWNTHYKGMFIRLFGQNLHCMEVHIQWWFTVANDMSWVITRHSSKNSKGNCRTTYLQIHLHLHVRLYFQDDCFSWLHWEFSIAGYFQLK